MSCQQFSTILVVSALLVSCTYQGTKTEAATIATDVVQAFCAEHPRGCTDLAGPRDAPAGPRNYAFEWLNARGDRVLLVVVDPKGSPDLTFGPGFDSSWL